jgi:hypothetical protein
MSHDLRAMINGARLKPEISGLSASAFAHGAKRLTNLSHNTHVMGQVPGGASPMSAVSLHCNNMHAAATRKYQTLNISGSKRSSFAFGFLRVFSTVTPG